MFNDDIKNFSKALRPLFRQISGTPAFFDSEKRKLMASWFITMSAADTFWKDFFYQISLIEKNTNTMLHDKIPDTERHNFLNKYPDIA